MKPNRLLNDLPLIILVAFVWCLVVAALVDMAGDRRIAYVLKKNEYISAYDACYESLHVALVDMRIRIALRMTEREWSETNVETLTIVLLAIEKRFSISHVDMLGIMLTESEMNIRCIGKKNKNGTRDYGLVQQNSEYLRDRYEKAKRILGEEGIPCCYGTFDIAVNVMSGAVTIDEFRDELARRGVYTRRAHLVAYNVGPTGWFMKSRALLRAQYLARLEGYLACL